MKNYIVYKHTSPSKKVYIGITSKKPEYRYNNGNGYKANPHFTNAIKKYGWDAFSHEIIAEGLTREEACEKEKEQIRIHNSTDERYGYNLSLGGESGPKFTEESKAKISESLKKYYIEHPEVIDEMRERTTGRKHSKETKEKMSESHRNGITDEMRIKMSESRKGKPCPHKGHPCSLETRVKISEKRLGNILEVTEENLSRLFVWRLVLYMKAQ